MIASDKCVELFDELKKRYDYIVIDTPPLGLVTDAFLLMRYTDANIFIVRQGHTNKNIFSSVIKDLEDRNANIAIVINGVETGKSYGYGKYSYGYGYGYGYGYDSDYYGEEADGKKKHRRHKSKQE